MGHLAQLLILLSCLCPPDALEVQFGDSRSLPLPVLLTCRNTDADLECRQADLLRLPSRPQLIMWREGSGEVDFQWGLLGAGPGIVRITFVTVPLKHKPDLGTARPGVKGGKGRAGLQD